MKTQVHTFTRTNHNGTLSLVNQHERAVQGSLALDLPVPRQANVVFASGANHPSNIHGFVQAGIAPGVAVNELSEPGLLKLESLAGTGVPIFVDSGAFSEVEPQYPFPVKNLITDEEWKSRLGKYQRLATKLHRQLYLVAPDMVGNQGITLERLSRYKAEVLMLHRMGANILLPVQRGAMSQAEFYRAAEKVLGFSPIPAFPMKKAGTSPQQVEDFLREVKPDRIHFLGLGPNGDTMPAVLQAIERAHPDVWFSQDSVLTRAAVGRDKESGKASPLTETQDSFRAKTEEEKFDDPFHEGIDDLASWMTVPERKSMAALLKMSPADTKAFIDDPDSAEGNDWLWAAVHNLWAKKYHDIRSSERMATAITNLFKEKPYARRTWKAFVETAERELLKAEGRAKKGGEQGVNGQRYEGGQFLPGSPDTDKGAKKSKAGQGAGKQEVGPKEWAEPPAEGARSIYQKIQAVIDHGILARTGKATAAANFSQVCDHYGWDKAEVLGLMEKWNAGMRWTAPPQSPALLNHVVPRLPDSLLAAVGKPDHDIRANCYALQDKHPEMFKSAGDVKAALDWTFTRPDLAYHGRGGPNHISILRRGANNHHVVVNFGSASGQFRVQHITLISDEQVAMHIGNQEVLWTR